MWKKNLHDTPLLELRLAKADGETVLSCDGRNAPIRNPFAMVLGADYLDGSESVRLR